MKNLKSLEDFDVNESLGDIVTQWGKKLGDTINDIENSISNVLAQREAKSQVEKFDEEATIKVMNIFKRNSADLLRLALSKAEEEHKGSNMPKYMMYEGITKQEVDKLVREVLKDGAPFEYRDILKDRVMLAIKLLAEYTKKEEKK